MFGFLLFFLLSTTVNADLIEECMNYTIYPLQYELIITPYVFKSSPSYHCDISIDVIANAPGIRIIELDAKELVFRQGSIRVLYGNTDIVNGARPYEYDAGKEKLYIYLREPLRKYDESTKSVYKIMISFDKRLKENSNELVLVKYYDEEGRKSYSFTTRFSPNRAKSVFPCFDNPRFESGFKFKFILPMTDIQHTNTTLVISEELRRERTQDFQIIHFMPSPQVALHQVGFHLSSFAHNQLQSKHTNDTLFIWAPVYDLPKYHYILNYGVGIIDRIHEYSGVRRPLLNGPINLVAVPSKLDGYEISSWNLLTNSAFKLAYVEGLTSIQQLERMKFELAQQLSRLWLGNPGENQVTRWKEQWFKEGIATYLAYYLLTQYSHGTQTGGHPLDYYGLRMKHTAMANDWHHFTPTLTTFDNKLAVEIPPRYKELVTKKTGAIWWMLENWLEKYRLKQSFVKHIDQMRGKYISIWDLMQAIDKDTIDCTFQFFNGSTPTRVLQSWFHEAGHPVVTVNVLRDRTPNAIQLKQRHFSYNQMDRKPTDYLIPISYLLQSRANCFNCQQPRFTISQTYTFSENLNGGRIILNRNATGYYRVNYDVETWKLIAASLKKDPTQIDEMNRAQIVNDVFALYVAGDIDRLLAEDILSYLDNERSFLVWEAAIDGFSMLRVVGSDVNVTRNLYWEWEKFMGERVKRIYSLLIKNPDRSDRTRLFRSNIVNFASEINYGPCLKYLEGTYHEYAAGKRLDPDLRKAMFYVVVNNTHTDSSKLKLTAIEIEDKEDAVYSLHSKERFLIKCPFGEPRPLPITATEKPVVSEPEKLANPTEKPVQPSSSAKIFASLLTVLFSLIITH